MTFYDYDRSMMVLDKGSYVQMTSIIAMFVATNSIVTSGMLDNESTMAPLTILQNHVPQYDYDCKLYELITRAFMNVFITIFGLIGNTLVTVTLWNERTKSPTSFLLIVLAFADNLVLIFGGFMMFGLT